MNAPFTRKVPVNRDPWPPGPWEQEPDEWWEVADGFLLLALREEALGHWVAWVLVPPGHPWHGEPGKGAGIEFWGQCAESFPLSPDYNGWWAIGHDYAHDGDRCPGDEEGENGFYVDLLFVQRQLRLDAAVAKVAAEGIMPALCPR